MDDLKLISGDFFDLDLPKECQYLFKYFPTDVQIQFLRYYYVFQDCKRFTEHTGFPCTKRWLRRLKRRYRRLTNLHTEAKNSGDFKMLAEIKMGKLKFRNK